MRPDWQDNGLMPLLTRFREADEHAEEEVPLEEGDVRAAVNEEEAVPEEEEEPPFSPSPPSALNFLTACAPSLPTPPIPTTRSRFSTTLPPILLFFAVGEPLKAAPEEAEGLDGL